MPPSAPATSAAGVGQDYVVPQGDHETLLKLSAFSRTCLVRAEHTVRYSLDELVGVQFTYAYSSPALGELGRFVAEQWTAVWRSCGQALARRARIPLDVAARTLHWLAKEGFVKSRDPVHFPGPLMILATGNDPEQTLLKDTLGALRDELDAAVYISTYTDGEITVRQSAFSTTAPPVEEWAPFSDTAHASAVGKSLLAQLDFNGRMDHLSRYPSVALTDRTITSRRALIEELDAPGPHSAQFDLLEYSESALCVAYSLGLPCRASSVALSLPAGQHKRLVAAARSLSQRPHHGRQYPSQTRRGVRTPRRPRGCPPPFVHR